MTTQAELLSALQRHLDSDGVLVGETVGRHGPNLRLRGRPDQLIGTPLSECASVGLALGLAAGGARVVVELIDPAGLGRATEALEEAARLAALPGSAWPLSLVVLVPEGSAPPPRGLRCLTTSVAAELPALLDEGLRSGPTVIQLVPGADAGEASAGVGPVSRVAGAGAVLVASGGGVARARVAAEALRGQVELIELRELPPTSSQIDELGRAVSRSGRLVLVGDEALLSRLVVAAFLSLESPPVALTQEADPDALIAALRGSLTY